MYSSWEGGTAQQGAAGDECGGGERGQRSGKKRNRKGLCLVGETLFLGGHGGKRANSGDPSRDPRRGSVRSLRSSAPCRPVTALGSCLRCLAPHPPPLLHHHHHHLHTVCLSPSPSPSPALHMHAMLRAGLGSARRTTAAQNCGCRRLARLRRLDRAGSIDPGQCLRSCAARTWTAQLDTVRRNLLHPTARPRRARATTAGLHSGCLLARVPRTGT